MLPSPFAFLPVFLATRGRPFRRYRLCLRFPREIGLSIATLIVAVFLAAMPGREKFAALGTDEESSLNAHNLLRELEVGGTEQAVRLIVQTAHVVGTIHIDTDRDMLADETVYRTPHVIERRLNRVTELPAPK